MTDEKKEFVHSLTEFYELFLSAVSDAVLGMANIQKKFKKEYNSLKDLQKDPSKLEESLGKLTDEQRGFLLRLFTKVASFESRLAGLFYLSVKEQEKLAEEIKLFSEEIKKKIENK